MTELTIDLRIETLKFQKQVLHVKKSLDELTKVFEDRDKWHTVTEGEWPDKFVLLNRFLRTGHRPPFIFNG